MNRQIIGKILMILMATLILVLAMALVWQVGNQKPQTSEEPAGSRAAPTPEQETGLPTRWATDSGILEIEDNLKKTTDELRLIDLREAGLVPPILDMDVKVETK